jgi:hypothetical protein
MPITKKESVVRVTLVLSEHQLKIALKVDSGLSLLGVSMSVDWEVLLLPTSLADDGLVIILSGLNKKPADGKGRQLVTASIRIIVGRGVGQEEIFLSAQ